MTPEDVYYASLPTEIELVLRGSAVSVNAQKLAGALKDNEPPPLSGIVRPAAFDQGEEFDAILIDPPSFSSSRKSGSFNIKDRYRPLVRAALRVLAPRGLLLCATNFRGISRDDFLHLLQDAASLEEHDLRVLTVLGQPADHPVVPAFPEAAYLHFALCATAVEPPAAWRP